MIKLDFVMMSRAIARCSYATIDRSCDSIIALVAFLVRFGWTNYANRLVRVGLLLAKRSLEDVRSSAGTWERNNVGRHRSQLHDDRAVDAGRWQCGDCRGR